MTEPDINKLEQRLNVERTSWLSDLFNNPLAWLAGVTLIGAGVSYGIHYHHSTKRAQAETRITELENDLKKFNVPNLRSEIQQLQQKNDQLAGDYANTQKALAATFSSGLPASSDSRILARSALDCLYVLMNSCGSPLRTKSR